MEEFPRRSEIALLHQRLAHFVVGDEEIALSARITGVGLGQPIFDGEAVLV